MLENQGFVGEGLRVGDSGKQERVFYTLTGGSDAEGSWWDMLNEEGPGALKGEEREGVASDEYELFRDAER